MRNCHRLQIIKYIEGFEKSVPVYYVAQHIDFSWQETKEMLLELVERGDIGALGKSGRFCRKEYAVQQNGLPVQ